MRLYFIYEKFKAFFLKFLIIFILLFSSNSQIAHSFPKDMKINDSVVIEELRLNVPSKFREVWLQAEREVWEPWLNNQNGFLGRQIFWNKDKEEALILVNWKNKKLWKSISKEEVEKIQDKFEEKVKTFLNAQTNPFEITYTGEIYKQK